MPVQEKTTQEESVATDSGSESRDTEGAGTVAHAEPAGRPGHEDVRHAHVQVRRIPRYGRFIGGTIGVLIVASFFATYLLPVGGDYTHAQVLGYLVLTSVAFGLPIGSVIALALDRLLAHTARTLVAEQIALRAAEVETPAVAASEAGEEPTSSGEPDGGEPGSIGGESR